MSALKLDPLGQSLLRQLAEAEENRDACYEARRLIHIVSHQIEYFDRINERDNLETQFLEHLLLIGSPDIDISGYLEIVRQEALIHEDDRDIGRVADAAQDVVYAYLELWREQ